MVKNTCFLKKCLTQGLNYIKDSVRFNISSEIFTIGNYSIKNFDRTLEESAHASVLEITTELSRSLEEFDQIWVTFEQLYVLELMLIEKDARRFITEAIKLDEELTKHENREKSKGKIIFDGEEYRLCREQIVTKIGQINSVSNPEGTGRDDLSVQILLEAESVTRRISPTQSKAARSLAERIKKAFYNLRVLFRRYDHNIEIVDPQLKNNPELVEALVAFESSWEKGKVYFLSAKRCNQFIHFSQIVEATSEKHKAFAEQVENRDAEIFISIPCLLVLKCLEEDDKNLCKSLCPPMFTANHDLNKKYLEMKLLYEDGRKTVQNDYDFYNLLEKKILEIEYTGKEIEIIANKDLFTNLSDKIMQKMKQLAIELSRYKPQEWNKFLDVILVSSDE